jgi:hypothetical protein
MLDDAVSLRSSVFKVRPGDYSPGSGFVAGRCRLGQGPNAKLVAMAGDKAKPARRGRPVFGPFGR